jgi:DNA-directed RNA polymerase specialized sigma subunit
MTRGKQTTALALAGAVALASGAYALGTQVDDGNAAAAKAAATPTPNAGPGGEPFGHGPRGFRGGGPRGFGGGPGGPFLDGLADRLGVSEDKLRAALEDLRTDAKDRFATELAAALGIDKAKVTAALDKAKPDRPHIRRHRAPRAFARALAKELGISTAKVRAALADRRGRPGGPDDLAKALGVTEQQLRDAFHAIMGKLRPPRGPGRPFFGNLADELGVTQQQLEDALAKVRDDHDQLRDELADELAKRLGLDPSKVQQALEESKPRHP